MPDYRYHGSGALFDIPDSAYFKGYRDFGKGFYLSFEYYHAQKMAVRGSRKTGNGYVYTYKLSNEFARLNVKYFESATEEWLDFILVNRENKENIHFYDAVVGPTADASVVSKIDDYYNGVYGAVGTSAAKRGLLTDLNVNVYPSQICLCSKAALNCLIKISVEEISEVNNA